MPSMNVRFPGSRRGGAWLVIGVAGLACSSVLGCKASGGPSNHAPSPSAAPALAPAAPVEANPSMPASPQPALAEPYPPGRWRLTNPQALASSALPLSHILVRHRGASLRASLFYSPLPWTPEPPPPERSREEAYAVAQELAGQAMSSPASFAELATRHSDDVTTRDTGGVLGIVRADSLYDWPEVLDAIAALSPGQVSRPVETEFGFHVLRLEPRPREEIVSARHLVVAYDHAPWLKAFMGTGNTPSRSREEAQRLAAQLYEQASAAPDAFVDLIRSRSDHQDASRDGAFGDWSSVELSPYPRTIARLESLAIGAIAPPLETFYGFEIVQRLAPAERERYSMEVIKLQVNPNAAPGMPNSASLVQAELQRIADEVRLDPSRFAAYQAQLCCANHVESWSAGRGSALAEHTLDRLKPGEVAASPVALGPTLYALLRRLPARDQPPPVAQFGLPSPEQPDVPFTLAVTDQSQIVAGVQRQASLELGLDAPTAERFSLLHDALFAAKSQDSIDERYRKVQEFQTHMAELLGTERYAKYARLLDGALEQQLLRQGPPAFPW